MNVIEFISRLIFLVTGAFHFLLNWSIFEINYFRGVYVWKMNINSIGEAQFEAILMLILIIPFLIGLFYFANDFKQKFNAEIKNVQ